MVKIKTLVFQAALCCLLISFNSKTVNCQTGVTVAGGNGNGSNADQLNYPHGVFVDRSGNVFVADAYNHRVQKWVPGATTGITVAGGNGGGYSANQLYNPWGVFVDSLGNIYIGDQANQRVQKWAPGATSGITVAGDSNGNQGSTANRFNFPSGIFVDGAGNVFVADYYNNRVQKWAPGATSGTTVAGGHGAGSNANQVWHPYGIFVDKTGNLFVADYFNNRIQKWAPGATSGITVAGGNGYGSNANQFAAPGGVVLDKAGNIYVADTYNNRIQKWAVGATSGITVGGDPLGTSGSGANQLNFPWSLCIDGSRNIFVADANNDRVQEFGPCFQAASITTTLCAGTSYAVGTRLHNATGLYVDTLLNGAANGCDSIVTLNLTVKQPARNTITASICAGTSYSVGTHAHNAAGHFIDTLHHAAANGCDSIVTLNLTVKQPARNTVTTTICSGTSYAIGTHSYNTAGQFIDTVHNGGANGCDSIVTLNLSFTPPVINVITTSICAGQSYTVGTQSFISDGQFFVTLTNAAASGCDSSVVLNLTVNPNPTPTLTGEPAICPAQTGSLDAGTGYSGYAWSTGAITQTIATSAANTYTVTVTNSNGCSATASQSVAVTTTVAPLVTITQDISRALCPGTNVTFTASSLNGGTSPSYQWLKNGGNVGTNSVTYSDNALADGDIISVVLTSNYSCASPTTATSNGLTQTVFHPVLTSSGGGCVNDNLIVNNAAHASQIAWQKNGTVVFTSTASRASTILGGNNGAGTGLNQLNAEYGLFRTVTGDIYVADRSNHRVIKFANSSTQASNGIIVAGGNGAGSAANQLHNPTSVLIDGNGNLYVCDQGNHRVQKFPAGSTSASNAVTVAGVTGQSGSTATKLNNPNSICFDAGGNLYVSDNGNHRIQKYAFSSTTATTAAGGNGAGAGANQLNLPTGIVVDASGNLFVSDQKNNRVQQFPSGSTSATNGVTVAGGNGQGITANQLNYPAGLFIDGSNNLYVADWNNYRVQQFPSGSTNATNGVTVAGNATSGPSLTQMRRPQGVAVDAFGAVYVSDQDNNRISVWGAAAPDTTYYPGAAGIYNAVVSFAGPCVLTTNPDTLKARVTPYISIHPTATSVVCGTSVTFTSTTTNAGTAPTFQWLKNGSPIQGATSNSYTDNTFLNNDTISCQIVSNIPCAITTTAISGKVIMTVRGCIAPISLLVTVQQPGTHFSSGCAGDLRATPQNFVYNSSNIVTYNWYELGNPNSLGNGIGGGAYSDYALVNFPTGIPIYCVMNMSGINYTSNKFVMNGTTCTFSAVPSLNGGSYKMDEDASIFNIYPNPASSILNLQIAKEGDLQIVNEIGQAVITQHLSNQQTQINISHLATGVYFYTFQSEGQVFRGKVVKE